VKATQDQDARSTSRGGAARCSDPQPIMFSDATECERNVLLYIPHVIIDVSTTEIYLLRSIDLSSFQVDTFSIGESGNSEVSEMRKTTYEHGISFAIRSDLITISTHLHSLDMFTKLQTENAKYCSFMLALERPWFHFLTHTKINTRLVVNDFSLYEGKERLETRLT
jgi:hypothetical protein